MSSTSSSDSPDVQTTSSTAQTSADSPTSALSRSTPDCIAGMTREVLSCVAHYLKPADRVAASAVCRTWRLALLGDQQLWRHFITYVPWYQHAAQMAFYNQTGKAIRLAEIVVQLEAENVPRWHRLALDQLQSVLTAPCLENVSSLVIQYASIRRVVYNLFIHTLHALNDEAKFHALQELNLLFALPQLLVGGALFSYLCDVETVISLRCEQTRRRTDIREELLMVPSPQHDTAPSLSARKLVLSGMILAPSLEMPVAGRLTHLHLERCIFGHNFYRLLEGAPQLRELMLHDVLRDGHDFARMAQEYDDDDDDETEDEGPPELTEDYDEYHLRRAERRYRSQARMPPVILHNLMSFSCTGVRTPCVWQSIDKGDGVRDVRMPRLRRACLCDLPDLDDEVVTSSDIGRFDLEDEDELEEYLSDPLQGLCSHSAWITELDLSRTSVSDLMLPHALKQLAGLSRLIIIECQQLSDDFVQGMVCWLPSLEYLDARRCPDITAAGCATAVSAYLFRNYHLQRVLLDDPGPSNCYSPYFHPRNYWDAKAFEWLLWIGVTMCWQDEHRSVADLKKPLNLYTGISSMTTMMTDDDDASRNAAVMTTSSGATTSSSKNL